MKTLICFAAFLLIAAQTGSAADIFFQPQFPTINVGDPLTVDVMISGVVSPWLGGYDIDISYDPAILKLGAVAWPDNFLSPSLRDTTFHTGMFNVAEVSLAGVADLGAAQSGNDPFRLFEIVFTQGLAPGTSPLTFDRVELADGNGDSLVAGNTAGSVTVLGTAIPEPGTALLMLVPSLAGFAILRRRRRG